jgi:fructokinase
MPASARSVIFGEVLYDCFPDGSRVLGGAPFNVAWHLTAFGGAPLFVSRVGDDPEGREVRTAMADWGMDAAALGTDPDRPTGTVRVWMEGGVHGFEIPEGQAFDRIAVPTGLPDAVALLYHGSLALRDPASRAGLAALIAGTGASVFLDVNLRAPWWDEGFVHELMARARWVKLNDDELDLLQPDGDDMAARARALLRRHDLDTLFLTKGSAGAKAFAADGGHAVVSPRATTQVVDTVGAGDAFASILVLGLTSGWSLQQTLDRAQDFASAVVGLRGATTRDRGFYRPFREAWGIG